MKADKFLEDRNIEFEVVEQENPTLDCDDAARERGVETSQIVKSLVLERNGEILHVLIPGDRELSEKKFGESRLLPPEESKEVTGFESGTVHPFSTQVKHFVDERILEKDRLSFTTGDSQSGVIIEKEEFREALEAADFDYEVKDLVVTSDRDINELKDEGLDEETASFIVENSYRKILFKAAEEFPAEDVAEAVQKLNRQEVNFDSEIVTELVERSESDTHMLKLAENFAEEGEFTEQSSEFDETEVVETILEENPDAVEDYRDGRESALNYLMGQVMEQTNGRADAGKVRQLLEEKLNE